MKRENRKDPGLPSGSMADIAFLLLTFYMLTTVIGDQKGLPLLLPPSTNQRQPAKINERNLYTIQINSLDQFLVEGELRSSIDGLRSEVREFIMNRGAKEHLSTTPTDAVVSIKSDRGTRYSVYISVLDEVQAAYYEIYAERVNLSSSEFRALDLNIPAQRKLYDRGRQGIPMNISIAEPTAIN